MKTGRPFVIQRHDTTAELKMEIKRSSDAAYGLRLRAIIKAMEGKRRGAIAEELFVSARIISDWVSKYNAQGKSGLLTKPTGRKFGPQKWDASHFEALTKEIDKGGYWSIPRMQEWLVLHEGVNIPEQTIWYRMNKLRYSYKGARPHPAQGNKANQAAFKKGVSVHFSSR